MTAEASPFDDVDFATWRGRVEQGGRTLEALAHLGLEGVGVEALYDRAPALALVVPPRLGPWACVQVLSEDVPTALDELAALPVAQVDAVAITGHRELDAVLDAVPAGVLTYVDAHDGAEALLAARNDAVVLADPLRSTGPDAMAAAVRRAAAHPGRRTWLCDGSAWHDAGSTAVDELGVVLAAALAALDAGEAAGLPASRIAAALALRVGLGGDLLVDVAKLRALRGLWHACASRLGVAEVRVPIHARSGRRNRSRADVDTNLVRAAFEAFAAATGGADALLAVRHDRGAMHGDGAPRWARNLSHLLAHECHAAAVDDPWAGSWALESLTAALAAAAWSRVQGIVRDGGLPAVLPDLHQAAHQAAARRHAAIAAGTHPLVGVSKYPPPGRAVAPPREPVVPEGLGPIDLCAPFEGGAR